MPARSPSYSTRCRTTVRAVRTAAVVLGMLGFSWAHQTAQPHDKADSVRICEVIVKVRSAALDGLNTWTDRSIVLRARDVPRRADDDHDSGYEPYTAEVEHSAFSYDVFAMARALTGTGICGRPPGW